MDLYDNKYYLEDINDILNMKISWGKLKNKSILLSGATGLIGSLFVDVILEKNKIDNLNCRIYAIGRSEQKAFNRFTKYKNNKLFNFIKHDIKQPLDFENKEKIDYVIHLASNTHPKLYSTDPIGTIETNIIGVKNMLNFATNHSTDRFIFASSNEIYGENRGDVDLFDEDYCGYINCNTLRAGYPESKRCAEALCQAYKTQFGLNVGIARFTRTYGPPMSFDDTKAISQFIKNSVNNKDIVLKSEGNQFYSYMYVLDAVSGLFYVLLNGLNGEAYNIADESGDIILKDLATYIAKINNSNLKYEIPDEVENKGYSVVTKARLNGNKLRRLGWKPYHDIYSGVDRTIKILKTL